MAGADRKAAEEKAAALKAGLAEQQAAMIKTHTAEKVAAGEAAVLGGMVVVVVIAVQVVWCHYCCISAAVTVLRLRCHCHAFCSSQTVQTTPRPAVLAVSAALESANTKHAGAITGATAAAAKAAAADKAASVAQVATPSSR